MDVWMVGSSVDRRICGGIHECLLNSRHGWMDGRMDGWIAYITMAD